MKENILNNPFRPGAGHMPPHLAGRNKETKEFLKLLKQDVILQNLVLTGLRGVGKTVLLDTFRPLALNAGWRWAGTDLSESTSISEQAIVTRLLTDLSIITSNIVFNSEKSVSIGFNRKEKAVNKHLNYEVLSQIFNSTPGLISDKLKSILELTWSYMQQEKNIKGIIFAYDEAQTMDNYPKKEQYPLSLLLDIFQSIQRKSIPFMLALTGLPTLFPKLVEARTFTERMFRVITLDKLRPKDSRAAITEPIKDCPLTLSEDSINLIVKESAGYPYFIQFICKEVFDAFVQQHKTNGQIKGVPIDEITRKLDNDFFAGRWAKATDRQRDLLSVIAHLLHADEEFTVQEVVEQSEMLSNPFGPSQVNQMLLALAKKGLVYKNRHGKYSFAVPLLGQYILRKTKTMQEPLLWDTWNVEDFEV